MGRPTEGPFGVSGCTRRKTSLLVEEWSLTSLTRLFSVLGPRGLWTPSDTVCDDVPYLGT